MSSYMRAFAQDAPFLVLAYAQNDDEKIHKRGFLLLLLEAFLKTNVSSQKVILVLVNSRIIRVERDEA